VTHQLGQLNGVIWEYNSGSTSKETTPPVSAIGFYFCSSGLERAATKQRLRAL